MKKLLGILGIILALGGCESFGKGVASALIEKDNPQDTRRCEITGSDFLGLDDYLEKGDVVMVMMIHGVGTHKEGYAARMKDNLSKALNLTVWSKNDKNITLIDPQNKKDEIGNLRVTRMQSEDLKKTVIFYELTWSSITAREKKILEYDDSDEYGYKRAVFNRSMKTFLNDTVPDPMIYLVDDKQQILNAAKEATCWMLSSNWENLQDKERDVCRVSSYNQIKDLSRENIVYITHSLGSRILLDSVIDVADEISNLKVNPDSPNAEEAEQIIKMLRQKEITVFMLANQLPLLQIGRPKPNVTNAIKDYCHKRGKRYNQRVFKEVKIIAFSDPNDLLSYGIPQEFVDEYIDSRICPSVTNIEINIADVISAFGVGVVNPVAAHTEYDNDERVIDIIAHGTQWQNQNADNDVSQKCQIRQLKE